jgi:type IV pilus assembly protein PilC
LPQFESIFEDFDSDLPQLTKWVLQLTHVLPLVIGSIFVVIGAIPLLSATARRSRIGRAVLEPMVLAIPLVGEVVRRNLVARWCDALRLGVEAGLDMSQALGLAGDAIASPAMQRDSNLIAECIRAGGNVNDTGRLLAIPATVPAVIDLSSRTGDLAGTLGSLSEMHQQEAEWRMAGLNAVITPLVVLFLGVTVGTMVLALFLPLAKLITELT